MNYSRNEINQSKRLCGVMFHSFIKFKKTESNLIGFNGAGRRLNKWRHLLWTTQTQINGQLKSIHWFVIELQTTASSKSRNYFDELKYLRIFLNFFKTTTKMRPESRPVSVPLLQQLWIISIKNDNRSPMKISRGAWITEVRLLLFSNNFFWLQ